MIFDYVLVAVLGFLAGGWAIPSAVTFGLDPFGVWLTASLGSSLGLAAMVWIGTRGRARLVRWTGRSEEGLQIDPRAQRVVDRWGVLGLAVFGMVVLGPTLTVIAALALDLDRRRFVQSAALATFVLYAALTAAWRVVL